MKYYADFKKNKPDIYGWPRENSVMHGDMLKATCNKTRKPIYKNVHRRLFAHAKRCLEPHTQNDGWSYFQKRLSALGASDLPEFFALSSDFNLKIKTTHNHTRTHTR